MLLHNQRNAPLKWEARGVEYSWEPYGPCDVPDMWLGDIKAQGLPVDVTPVTPQRKVEEAADAERKAAESSELRQLQQKLADAESRAAEAGRATEMAESRAARFEEKLAEAEAKNDALSRQLQQLKAENSEYEKMMSESLNKVDAMQRDLDLAAAEKKQRQQPKK